MAEAPRSLRKLHCDAFQALQSCKEKIGSSTPQNPVLHVPLHLLLHSASADCSLMQKRCFSKLLHFFIFFHSWVGSKLERKKQNNASLNRLAFSFYSRFDLQYPDALLAALTLPAAFISVQATLKKRGVFLWCCRRGYMSFMAAAEAGVCALPALVNR